MKKLTAGILASLIGLVSANSADAAVASKTYVDGAIGSLDVAEVGSSQAGSVTYIKNIKEVDGKIEATSGDLAAVALSGDYADLDTKLTVTSDGTTGNVVTGVGLSEDGNSVVVTKGNAVDTKYAFKDTATVDFTQEAERDENGNVVIKADVLPGKGLKIDSDGKLVTSVIGEGHVEIDYNADGELVITGTDTTKSGPDVEVAEDGTVKTKYYDAKNTADNTGEDWYVLMRKNNGDGTFSYSWENIDRSYEAQPAQPTQE